MGNHVKMLAFLLPTEEQLSDFSQLSQILKTSQTSFCPVTLACGIDVIIYIKNLVKGKMKIGDSNDFVQAGSPSCKIPFHPPRFWYVKYLISEKQTSFVNDP